MLIGPCSTTEDRDPGTSTPLIILGRRISLDIAQVVRWKSSPTAEVLHTVRCAASFAGYVFYGEIIRECEYYRWMDPARYAFSGTMVFLKHRWAKWLPIVGPLLLHVVDNFWSFFSSYKAKVAFWIKHAILEVCCGQTITFWMFEHFILFCHDLPDLSNDLVMLSY